MVETQTGERLYLLKDAAEAYEPILTVTLLRRLVHEGRIGHTKVGGRIVFSETDINTYINAARCVPKSHEAVRRTQRRKIA